MFAYLKPIDMCYNIGFSFRSAVVDDTHSNSFEKEVEIFINNVNCNKTKCLLNQILDVYEISGIYDSGRFYFFNKKGDFEKLPDLETHGVDYPRYKIEYFMYTYNKRTRRKHSYLWVFSDGA